MKRWMQALHVLPSGLRRSFYNQLEAERPDQRGLSVTNWGLFFLILFSLALYTAETEREIGMDDSGFFWFLNVVILATFGIEFVLRLYAVGANDKCRGWRGQRDYARANWFMIAVDFLAFAPELFLIAIGISPPSWLRMLRVARLFKMARYFPAFKLVADAVRSCAQELLAALAVATLLWYLAAVLLYLAESEAQPEAFGSITRSMWWSVVTLTTVGYGDSYPVTAFGKVLAGIIAVLGIGAVALPSGILAGAFIEKFRGKRQA